MSDLNDFTDYVLQIRNLNTKVPKRSIRDREFDRAGEFKRRYRFSKEMVRGAVFPLIENQLKKLTNRGLPIPPIIQLCVCLYFYATGNFQTVTGDLRGVSQPTLSRVIKNISTIIASYLGRYVKFSETQENNFPSAAGCVDAAARLQQMVEPLVYFCRGLLAGICLGHYALQLYHINTYKESNTHLLAPTHIVFVALFYFFCTLCFVYQLDNYDIGHMEGNHLLDLLFNRKRFFAIILYGLALIMHTVNAVRDEMVASFLDPYDKGAEIEAEEFSQWVTLSKLRCLFALIACFIETVWPFDDMLYFHLRNLRKFEESAKRDTPNSDGDN